MPYELVKTLHVLGAVLFVGNIVVTAVWKTFADRSRDPVVIAFGQRLVTVTDIALTATGAALLAVTGRLMAERWGGALAADWLVWGWMLFAASGTIWIAVLIPVQYLQARLTRAFRPGGTIPERYWRLARLWMGFGIPATILPLLSVGLMVLKPGSG